MAASWLGRLGSYTTEGRLMSYWIFQANPALYRIFGALGDADAICYWTVTHYQHDIAPGDQFALLASGPKSGVFAFGVVIAAAELRPGDPCPYGQYPEDDHEPVWQIRIRINDVLENPIPWSNVVGDPDAIIRLPGKDSSFLLNEIQWQAICSNRAERISSQGAGADFTDQPMTKTSTGAQPPAREANADDSLAAGKPGLAAAAEATQRSNAKTRGDYRRSRAKKVIAWVRKNGAVSLIAGIALVLGVAVVTVAVVKHQSGDSVYLGLTLVVSVAILLAAVAAAIYAKPAYDEVVAQRLPPKLEISDITILDAESKRLTTVGVASSLVSESGDPIERYETRAGSTIRLQASIRNTGKSSARFIFNCHVPAACAIRPMDHPGLAHYPAVPELYPLTADEELCNWTTARLDLPSGLTVTFHLDISLPDEAREGDDGWPMDVLVSGERDWQRSVQNKTWFVYPIDSPATDC